MDAEQNKKIYDKLMMMLSTMKNSRSNYEEGWKAITRFCSPDQDFWTTVKENSQKATTWIYDGTAQSALKLLANGLQGYLASKQTKSFNVEIQSMKAVNHKPFSGRLRRYSQELDASFYDLIDKSNFYQACNEIFTIGGSIATVVVYVEKVPDEKAVVCLICHPNDVWIAENDVRQVDTVFRHITMTAKDIVRRWGSELDEQFMTMAREKPYGLHELYHASIPRDTRDVTKIDNLNKKYASYWILPEKTKILQESGFDSNPYVCWRWSTPNNATWGRGPAHEAMAMIIKANRMGKDIDEAANLFLYPPLNVPTETQGKLDLRPRGMNPYTDPRRTVSPIQTTGSYPIAIDREQATQQAIKDAFFTDMFLMLNNSADSKRTATEVLEMQAEKAAIMGAITSRIESELFDPLFDRFFEIASEQGWLPVPPPELYEMLDGAELKVDYVGPMAQVQRRFSNAQSIDQPMGELAKYAQIFPEILDTVDPDELAKQILDGSTINYKVIRTPQALAAIRQQRMQAIKAQEDAQNAKLNASAVKDLSQADPAKLQQMTGQGAQA